MSEDAWELKTRDYQTEFNAVSLPLAESDNKHPLLATAEEPPKKKMPGTILSSDSDFDPLSGGPSVDDDPLSFGLNHKQNYYEDEEDDPIIFFTKDHLAKYSEKDMPANNFILRLEKLNNSDAREPEEVHELSFQGVIELADQRKSELAEAWRNDERVKSLKIVIQLCKFLTDVTYPYLYPRLFSIVSQSLDQFGERVYERLCVMAFKTTQPGRFSPTEVDPKTKETAQNWLFKVSSIRELIPRLFVEAAMLRIFSFLLVDPYTDTLARLLAQSNGIGHPLIQAYTRSYIVKKGLETDRTIRELAPVDPHTMLIFRGQPQPASFNFAPVVQQGRGRTQAEKEKEKVIFRNNFDDFLFQLTNAKSDKRKEEMKSLGIDFSKYLRVYSPCMQMLITSLFRSNKDADMTAVLLQLHQEVCPDSLLLYHLIELSPPYRVVAHVDTILDRIRKDPGVAQFLESVKKKKSDDSSSDSAPLPDPIPSAYNLARLLSELGKRLCESPPPKEMRLPLLNAIWKMATKIPNIQEYLLVARSFIQFPILYCTDRETAILLGDIQRHVTAAEEFNPKTSSDDSTASSEAKEEPATSTSSPTDEKEEDKEGDKKKGILASAERVTVSLSVLPPVHTLLADTLCNAAEVHKSIFALSQTQVFQQLSALLSDDEGTKLGNVLMTSLARPNEPRITDSLTTHFLFEMAKKAFLWADSFTSPEETLRMDRLLVQFAAKVDLGKDIEQQLSFYVDLRRVFPKFELLRSNLVLFVNNLAMKTSQMVQFHHTKRTINFIKGCVAFCHVTCPSVSDVEMRIRLLLSSAFVAYANNLIGQGEVLMKLMILEIPNIQTSKTSTDNESLLLELCSEICSLLVITPGHPTYGAFVMVRLLLKMVNEYPFREDTPYHSLILTRILSLLGALSQQSLPYHVKGLDSNDALYNRMDDYVEELTTLFIEITKSVLEELVRLSTTDTQEQSRRSIVAIGVQLMEVLSSVCAPSVSSGTVIQKAIEMVFKVVSPSLIQKEPPLNNFIKHFQKMAEEEDAPSVIRHLWSYISSLLHPKRKK